MEQIKKELYYCVRSESDGELYEKANLVYKFASLYNDYMTEIHDYGTGQKINMVEVHTLTAIEENPNITITHLANIWHRTPSAFSQIVKKLENKGLVVRERNPNNSRNILLNVTPAGLELSLAHKKYDAIDVAQTIEDLKLDCSEQEIENFFKVMTCYIKLFEIEE